MATDTSNCCGSSSKISVQILENNQQTDDGGAAAVRTPFPAVIVNVLYLSKCKREAMTS